VDFFPSHLGRAGMTTGTFAYEFRTCLGSLWHLPAGTVRTFGSACEQAGHANTCRCFELTRLEKLE